MSAIIGALRAELSASIAEFQSDLGKAADSVKGFVKECKTASDALSSVGEKMSLAITAPLLLLGKASLDQAKEVRQGMAQIEAALASTGGQSGKTADQLMKSADALENISTYDKADILTGVTSQLLRFGNISGDTFDRTEKAVVNLAARLGMDLPAAASVVGKAINQPLTGLTALRKLGITFTEDQKKLILALLSSGQGLKAQGMILDELENKFNGAALAARKASPDAALMQSWHNLEETLGQILIPLLQPFVDMLDKLVKKFQELNPELQKNIVIWAGMAAVVGPALVVIAKVIDAVAFLAAPLAELGAILADIFTGEAMAGILAALGSLAGIFVIIGAAVVAVGALIYQARDVIVTAFQDIWSFASAILGDAFSNLLATLGDAWTKLVKIIVDLWNGPLGDVLRFIGQALASLAAAFIYAFGGTVVGLITILVDVVAAAAIALVDSLDAVVKFLKGDFVGAWQAAKKAATDAADAIMERNKKKPAPAAPAAAAPMAVESVTVHATRPKPKQSFDLGTQGQKLKDTLDKLATAATKDGIEVRKFASGGLDPLAKSLEDVDTKYEGLRNTINGHITDLKKAGLGSKEAQDTYAKLTGALSDLEKAHKAARDAAVAQYQAEKQIADLQTQAANAQTANQIRDLAVANGSASGPMSTHQANLQKATDDLQAQQYESAIKLKELEAQRAEASRVGDQDSMNRLDSQIELQQKLYDLVSHTTAQQLEAADSVATAWKDVTDGISQQLSDMLVNFSFDMSSVKSLLKKIVADLIKPATDTAGDFIGAGIKALFAGGFATGGMIPAGQWGIAGENGPEPIFGGRTGMTVIPAQDGSARKGGDTYIDARGADTAAVARLAGVVKDLQKREGGRVKSYAADQRNRSR